MQLSLVVVLSLTAFAPVQIQAENVTPVQKVIQMMQEMMAKGQAEKEAEIQVMEEYTEWVDDTVRQLGFEIKTSKAAIEKLTAQIEKAAADIATLTDEIAVLDGDIATWEADQKAATGIREKEKAEYEVEQKDLSESVDALGRAITVLEGQQGETPQALLQKMAVTMPPMRRVLAAFLEEQSQTKTAASGAPAVAAYESQSGGIVEMLEKLLKKFKKELADCEEEEANKAHNYDLEMLHLSNSIEAANSDRDEKAAVKADKTAQKAEAEGQLADTKADLAEDEKTLADTQATFEVKKTAFAANQEVRAEELKAIQKAIEIISSQAVSGAADKHLPGLVQQAASFVQLRSGNKAGALQQMRTEQVLAYLQKEAGRLNSKVLSMAAVHAAADPFAKVTKMIREMIEKLKEEAAAEAEHKAYCDKELHDNKVTRDEKTAKVEQLTAQSEELGALIAKLGEEIQVLIEEQAALDKAMKEATEVRTKEKEKNTQTIADAKAAQEAVGQALAVLKEFYDKQGAFLQQVPEMKAYKGMGGAKKGVVGMLEVIESDFARLEAETTAEEDEAARAYETFMSDSKEAKEQKHKDEFDKKMLKDKKEFELKHVNEDLQNTQDELDAALAYYDKLKPECIEVKVSYEERVKRREEEIESLKEAYKILNENS